MVRTPSPRGCGCCRLAAPVQHKRREVLLVPGGVPVFSSCWCCWCLRRLAVAAGSDRPHSGVVVVARFAGRIVSVVSESVLQPPSSLSLACCRHRRLGGNLTYVRLAAARHSLVVYIFFVFFLVVLWTNQGRDLAGVAKTEQNLSNARIPARASRERQTPRLYVTTSSRMAFCLRARSLRHAALTTTFGRSSFASLFLSRCLSPHHVAVAVPALFLLYLYSIILSCFRD